MYRPILDNQFAREAIAGLTRDDQKTLPSRYLYDEIGSALFEAITLLPEYGLTRADARIIDAHAREIVSDIPRDTLVAELGSGSGSKTRKLLEAMGRAAYFPIDVSAAALSACARELAPVADVWPIEASYLDGLRDVASRRYPGQMMLVLFLGSTIGNFDPDDARAFLYSIARELRAGDALLLGTDLLKPVRRLLDAYDDPTGVTAAFNLNLLGRMNRELDADFDLRRFEHLVRYNGAAQRIEMHLRSLVNQYVRVQKAELTVRIEAGETIHTESCHKFRLEQIGDLARAGGFRIAGQWIDEEWAFAESLMVLD